MTEDALARQKMIRISFGDVRKAKEAKVIKRFFFILKNYNSNFKKVIID